MCEYLAASVASFGFLRAGHQAMSFATWASEHFASGGYLKSLLDRRLGLHLGHLHLLAEGCVRCSKRSAWLRPGMPSPAREQGRVYTGDAAVAQAPV
jgi:hypothetical protein